MDRRRTAGALLALAACLACANAAPRYTDSTALASHEGGVSESSDGCYYNFQHYGEGDRIMTNEPCLNCTCHNRMLMCYLRVCPFTKPIGQDCTIEKRADQCCPIITCPDVPVDLLTSTSTTSAAEYGMTGVGGLDKYGCSIHGKFFPEGAKVPPTPNKPCEHCYCIRNMTSCTMQECTLHVDGCTPIFHKDVCCPVRYSCDHDEELPMMLDHMTTTEGTTPGVQWTTTVAPSLSLECVHGEETYRDGALIKTEKACDHCYCMKGDIVCVVQECGTPMENEGKNCTSMPPREGQCCPDTYICEGDSEVATDETITATPPRRFELNGTDYRAEDNKKPTDEITEGSGFFETTDSPMHTTEEFIFSEDTSAPMSEKEKDIKETTSSEKPYTTIIPTDENELYTTITSITDKEEFMPVTDHHDMITTQSHSETEIPIKHIVYDAEEKPTDAPEKPSGPTEKPLDQTENPDNTYTTIVEEEHTTDGYNESDNDESVTTAPEISDKTHKPPHSDDIVKHPTTTVPDLNVKESTTEPRYPIINNEKEDFGEELPVSETQTPLQEITEKSTITNQEKYTTVSQEQIIDPTVIHEQQPEIKLDKEKNITSSTLAEDETLHQTTSASDDFNKEVEVTKAKDTDETSTLLPKESIEFDQTTTPISIENKEDYTTVSNKVDEYTTTSKFDEKETDDTIEQATTISDDEEYKKGTMITPEPIVIDEITKSSEKPDRNTTPTIPAEIISDNRITSEQTKLSEPTEIYEDSVITTTPLIQSNVDDIDQTEGIKVTTDTINKEPEDTTSFAEEDDTSNFNERITTITPIMDEDEIKTEKATVIPVNEDNKEITSTEKSIVEEYTTLPHKLTTLSENQSLDNLSPSIEDQSPKYTTITDEYTTPQSSEKESSSSEEQSSTSDMPDKGYNTVPIGSSEEEESFTTMATEAKQTINIDDSAHTTSTSYTTKQPIASKDDHVATSSDQYEPTVYVEDTTGHLDLPSSEIPDHIDTDQHTSVSDKGDESTTSLPISDVMVTATVYADKETQGPELAVTRDDTLNTQTESSDTTTEKLFTKPEDLAENEIPEDYVPPISSPGIIPGEGSCLVDGVTFSNNSVIPSTNKCQTTCKCISSIVKCDTISCSAPPDNMINCQPVYDTPESCCPSYTCDDSKETIPPQPHSQMAVTEPPQVDDCGENCHKDTPAKQPERKCTDTQCEVIEDEIVPVIHTELCTSDTCTSSSTQIPYESTSATQQKDSECGPEGCIPTKTSPSIEICSKENGCDTDQKPPMKNIECTDDSCRTSDKDPDSITFPDCSDGDCTPHDIQPEPAVTIKDKECTGKTDCPKPTKSEDCVGESCVQDISTTEITALHYDSNDTKHSVSFSTPSTIKEITLDDQHKIYEETKTTTENVIDNESKQTTTTASSEKDETIPIDDTKLIDTPTTISTIIEVTTDSYVQTEQNELDKKETIIDEIVTASLDSKTTEISPTDSKTTNLPSKAQEYDYEHTSEPQSTDKETDLSTVGPQLDKSTEKAPENQFTTIKLNDMDLTEHSISSSVTEMESDVTKDEGSLTTKIPEIQRIPEDKYTSQPYSTTSDYVSKDTTEISLQTEISEKIEDKIETTTPYYVELEVHSHENEATEKTDSQTDYNPINVSTNEPHKYEESETSSPTLLPEIISTTEKIDDGLNTIIPDREKTDINEESTKPSETDNSSHESTTVRRIEHDTEQTDYSSSADDEITSKPTDIPVYITEMSTKSSHIESTTAEIESEKTTVSHIHYTDTHSLEPETTNKYVTESESSEPEITTLIQHEKHTGVSDDVPTTLINLDETAATTLSSIQLSEMTNQDSHIENEITTSKYNKDDETTMFEEIDRKHYTTDEIIHEEMSTSKPLNEHTSKIPSDESTTTKPYYNEQTTITIELEEESSTHIPIKDQQETKQPAQETTIHVDSYEEHFTKEPEVNKLTTLKPSDNDITTVIDLFERSTYKPVDTTQGEFTTLNLPVDHETTTYIEYKKEESTSHKFDTGEVTTPIYNDQETTIAEEKHDESDAHKPITEKNIQELTTPIPNADDVTVVIDELSTVYSKTEDLNDITTDKLDINDNEQKTTVHPQVSVTTGKPSPDESTPTKITTVTPYIETKTSEPHDEFSTLKPVTAQSEQEESSSIKLDVDHEIKTTEVSLVEHSTLAPVNEDSLQEEKTTITVDVNYGADNTEVPYDEVSTHKPVAEQDLQKEMTTIRPHVDYDTRQTEAPHDGLSTLTGENISEEVTTETPYFDHETRKTEAPYEELSTLTPVTIKAIPEDVTTLKPEVGHDVRKTEAPRDELSTLTPVTDETILEKITTMKPDVDLDTRNTEGPHDRLSTLTPFTDETISEKITTIKPYVDLDTKITEEPHDGLSTLTPVSDEDVLTAKPDVEHATMKTVAPHDGLSTPTPVTDETIPEKITTMKPDIDHDERKTEAPHDELPTTSSATEKSISGEIMTTKLADEDETRTPEDSHDELSTVKTVTEHSLQDELSTEYISHDATTEASHDELSTHKPVTEEEAETEKLDFDNDTKKTEMPHASLSTLTPVSEYTIQEEVTTEKLNVYHVTSKTELPHDGFYTLLPGLDQTIQQELTTLKHDADYDTKTTEASHDKYTTLKPVTEQSSYKEITTITMDMNHDAQRTEAPHEELSTHKSVTDKDVKVEITTREVNLDLDDVTTERIFSDLSTYVPPTTAIIHDEDSTHEVYTEHTTSEQHDDSATHKDITTSKHNLYDDITTATEESSKPLEEETLHKDITTQKSNINQDISTESSSDEKYEKDTTQKVYTNQETTMVKEVYDESSTPKILVEDEKLTDHTIPPSDITTEESISTNISEEEPSKPPSTEVKPEEEKIETIHDVDATSEPTKVSSSEEVGEITSKPTTHPSIYDKDNQSSEPPAESSEIPEPSTHKPATEEQSSSGEDGDQPSPDHFPPSGTGGYNQEPDYGDDDQTFGPGTCRYGGKVYVSAQQIPRDDPCDFCFCFRSDIICLQQSCPPPIHGCHEEPIQGFCCPRYECPVSMATSLNVTTTTTTTTTTLPPHFLPHAYKGAAQRKGCQIKGHSYQVGEVVKASSGPCLHCTCGGDGQMKCDPKVCTPEPMLRQMIAAAVSSKRR